MIFHLAAQVAVTASVTDPRTDFDINALGTLNVLEGARLSGRKPLVVYASTNKVYGGLEDVEVEEQETRYVLPALAHGVPETRPVDFHSPYGCSKGSADLYTIDYARIYDLPTVVFRQSCIYGPWQYGNEDQGWIAHFLIRALHGEGITLYGDGKQVRDVLFVADLLELYDAAVGAPEKVAGRAYNIGGGPDFTTSLLEFVRPPARAARASTSRSRTASGARATSASTSATSGGPRPTSAGSLAPRSPRARAACAGGSRLPSSSAHRLRRRGRLHAVLRPRARGRARTRRRRGRARHVALPVR